MRFLQETCYQKELFWAQKSLKISDHQSCGFATSDDSFRVIFDTKVGTVLTPLISCFQSQFKSLFSKLENFRSDSAKAKYTFKNLQIKDLCKQLYNFFALSVISDFTNLIKFSSKFKNHISNYFQRYLKFSLCEFFIIL